MQSKAKTRRTSSTSSSAGSTTRRSRLKKPPTSGAVCNGSAALPFKKRKLAAASSEGDSTGGSLSPRCFAPVRVPTVALVDMLKDEQLCTTYGLHEKLERSTGSVATPTTASSHSDAGDYLLDEEEEEELVNGEQAAQMAEERKVVMQKNNMIMITRCVNTNEGYCQPTTVQRRALENCYYSNGSRTGSESCSNSEHSEHEEGPEWNGFVNNGSVCIGDNRGVWKANYTIHDSDLYRITSQDTIFHSAQFPGENTPEPQLNGITNRKMQLTKTSSFSGNVNKLNCVSMVSTGSFKSVVDGEVFKVPLPPVKRPPTRPVRTSNSSDEGSGSGGGSCVGVQRSVVTANECVNMQAAGTPTRGKQQEGHQDDDDVLSIAASSLMDAEQTPLPEECTENKQTSAPSNVPSENTVLSIPSAAEIAAKNDDIQRWLNCNSSSSATNSSSLPWSPLSDATKNAAATALGNNRSVSPAEAERRYLAKFTIPYVYRKMCGYYIFDGYECKRYSCPYHHDVHAVREAEILSMDLPELKDVYKWTVSNSKLLFLHLFKTFARRLSRLQQIGELIKMVDDVFTVDVFDRTPYVHNVVMGLQNAGMEFKSAIKTLIEHKRDANVSLLDILLNLVINADANLADNWMVVEEIFKHRSGDIDFGVLSDIIKMTLKSGDKELCRKVCGVLSQLEDFSNVDTSLLYDFLTVLWQHRLTLHYNTLRSKTKIEHIVMNGESSSQEACRTTTTTTTAEGGFAPWRNGVLQQHQQTEIGGLQNNVGAGMLQQHQQNEVGGLQNNVGAGMLQQHQQNEIGGLQKEVARLHNSVAAVSKQKESHYPDSKEFPVPEEIPPQQLPIESDSCCLLPLECQEIVQVLSSIKSRNYSAFRALLNKYKLTNKVHSFAVNTSVFFNYGPHTLFLDLLKGLVVSCFVSIEELVEPGYLKDSGTKYVMEMISYNVMDFLTRKKKWDVAYQVLVAFEDHLDSFVRCKEFSKNGDTFSRSLGERYLYICKIYTENHQYRKALDIVLRDDLKFYKPCSEWSVAFGINTTCYRNHVFRGLLIGVTIEPVEIQSGLCLIHKVLDMSKNDVLIKDAWYFYNKLLLVMLDKKDKYRAEILQEFKERILFWKDYKVLRSNLLRGLAVVTLRFQDVVERDLINYYEKCCAHDVYPKFEGTESAITALTDMVSEEIYLMLLSFFYKMAMHHYKPRDLQIYVRSPPRLHHEPKVLENSDVSFIEMKLRVANVLTKAFEVVVEQDSVSGIEQYVEVKEEYVASCSRLLKDKYGGAVS